MPNSYIKSFNIKFVMKIEFSIYKFMILHVLSITDYTFLSATRARTTQLRNWTGHESCASVVSKQVSSDLSRILIAMSLHCNIMMKFCTLR